MSQAWRTSYAWRKAKAICKRRDKVCQICGTRKKREVHHIEDASSNPELVCDQDNLIVLCSKCHRTFFHILYMWGYAETTDKSDLKKFMAIAKYYIKVGIKLGKVK